MKEISRSRAAREYIKELLSDGEEHTSKEISIYIKKRWQDEHGFEVEMTNGCISRGLMDLIDINKESGEIRYARVKEGIYKQYKEEELRERSTNALIKIIDDTISKLDSELKKLDKINVKDLSVENFKNVQIIKNITLSLNEYKQELKCYTQKKLIF